MKKCVFQTRCGYGNKVQITNSPFESQTPAILWAIIFLKSCDYRCFREYMAFLFKLFTIKNKETNKIRQCLHQSILRFACYLKTRIFPIVLYGCEPMSPTLREQQELRVSEHRVLLMRKFGHK
jgi:hypothetical protein